MKKEIKKSLTFNFCLGIGIGIYHVDGETMVMLPFLVITID